MRIATYRQSSLRGPWLLGLALLAAGTALILARLRPLSDFYFPVIWLGLTLLLDAAVGRQTGRSLWSTNRRLFLAMFPVSACFWWYFEWLNLSVNNWRYVGAEPYTGPGFVAFASVSFSTVLPAVWGAASCVYSLLPVWTRRRGPRPLPPGLQILGVALGVVCLVLPLALPRVFFGLIWCGTFLVLDPINLRLQRPSLLQALWEGNWRLPAAFALGALFCGLCWEGWNYWSLPRWVYAIPYVGFWHVFEMPLLGWGGYLPFGLELFAMANFVLPWLGLGTVTLAPPERIAAVEGAARAS